MEKELKDMIPIEPTGEISVKVPESDKTIIPEKPIPAETKNTPWYKANGFKRGSGALLMIVGGALYLFPNTQKLGEGIYMLGVSLGAVGVAHAMQKSKPTETNPEKGAWYQVVEGLKQTVNSIKKK